MGGRTFCLGVRDVEPAGAAAVILNVWSESSESGQLVFGGSVADEMNGISWFRWRRRCDRLVPTLVRVFAVAAHRPAALDLFASDPVLARQLDALGQHPSEQQAERHRHR